MLGDEVVVKKGSYFYAGQFPVRVHIINRQWRYGTGDYEDSPEIQDDVAGNWFSIVYLTTTERGISQAEGGTFPSLAEAIHYCETQCAGQISWSNDNESVDAA